MKTMDEFIETITDDEGIMIVSEYKEYARTGSIGETILRTKGGEWLDIIAVTSYGITRAMDDIHNRITQRFADRYIEELMAKLSRPNYTGEYNED